MRVVALDIETIPLARTLAVPYPEDERTPPANYKTEASLSKWRERDQERWREGRAKVCSLNPRLGRVLAVGLASDDGTDRVLYAEQEGDEMTLLLSLQAHLLSLTSDTLVTWNGKGFDLPFVLVRSAIQRVTTTGVRAFNDRYARNHIDVKHYLLNGDVRREGEGLDEWAEAFGLPTKRMSGADVWPAFQRGEHKRIQGYVLDDARKALVMYQRVFSL